MVEKLQSITTFVFDMDGVLTDGNLLLDQNGNWLRIMNIKDGYALQLAVKKGYNIIVVSGSVSEPVSERLHKLGIRDIRFDISDKRIALQEIKQRYKLNINEILYMGDDIPDLKALENCGIFCCPLDAVQDVLDHSNWISSKNGGQGAVREVIEKVLRSQEKWDSVDSISSI